MAVTLDTTLGSGNAGGATSVSMTTTNAVAAGALIVLVVGSFRSGVLSSYAASGGGLTWTQDHFVISGNIRIAILSAFAPAGLASATVLTATPAPSGSTDLIVAGGSFLGVDTASKVSGLNGAGATGTAWTSGNITANAGDMLIAGSFEDGNGATSSTPTAPAVELFDVAVAGQSEVHTSAYKLSMSATDATAGTWAASVTHIDAGVAYKAAVAAGAEPRLAMAPVCAA